MFAEATVMPLGIALTRNMSAELSFPSRSIECGHGSGKEGKKATRYGRGGILAYLQSPTATNPAQ
jgi:hypothetical protein